MNLLIDMLARVGLLSRELDYNLLRAAMVVIFACSGWDEWHVEGIRQLVPLITHGPLIFRTSPVLGIRRTSILLGASEWTFGLLLFLGFWNKRLGILGALGFIATFTISPFAPSSCETLQAAFRPCRPRAPSCSRISSCWRSPSTCSGKTRRA